MISLKGVIEIGGNNNINLTKDIIVSSNTTISSGDLEKPTFGIISNGGDISLYDFSNQFLTLVKDKTLHSGIPIRLWLENDENGAQEPICTMRIQSLSYNSNDKKIDITLKDNIEDWQNITIPSIDYDPRKPSVQNGQFYYEYLYNQTITAGGFNILSFNELDTITQNKLKGVVIKYPILESGTLWDSWDKLANLCFLRIYIDNNNRVVVQYAEYNNW